MAGQSGSNVISWDEYFMSIAFLSGKRSKDPITQVGAVIVNKDERIVGIGYNGAPNGYPDDEMPWNDPTKRKEKYMYVCSAAMNAIINKQMADLRGCKMYTSLFPDNESAKIIVQSGIKEIIYACDKYANEDGTKAAKKIFEMVHMEYREFKPEGKMEINFGRIEVTRMNLD